jgi:hypothetical protein
LKLDEFPDPGEEVYCFQVISGKLAGQNPRAFQGAEANIDQNQISARNFASSAMNGDFLIGQAFIPDFKFQPGGQVFQVPEERGFRKRVVHIWPGLL